MILITLSIGLTALIREKVCAHLCARDFPNSFPLHGLMKAELPVSVKDYRRSNSAEILLCRIPIARSPAKACRRIRSPFAASAGPYRSSVDL